MDTEKQYPDIHIQITQNFQDTTFDSDKLKKLTKTICSRFNVTKTNINIVIADDDEMQKLNKQFLDCDRTTDCLSFDLSESKPNLPRLFDMVVNGQKATREAKSRNHSNQAELALYVTHCLLHNLGFNDLDPIQAEKMHSIEDEILQQAGYGLVYNPHRRFPD